MKKLIALTFTVLASAMLVLTLNNCNKVPVEKENSAIGNNDNTSSGSKSMVEHILAFKEKMEYYHDHPGLKSGGSLYTADSAVLEMESLLNFNFCYTGIECNKKTFVTSEVVMPLDSIAKINDPDLMQVYYDKIIDTIQAQMNRMNYDSTRLLLVDLEYKGVDSNGDAIVSVESLLGNERNIVTTNNVGYWYGELMGTCQHAGLGITDATTVLTDDIYFFNFPAPPPGKRRIKTDIVTLPIYKPEDYFLVPEDERDNFEDSRLFYANEIYGTITADTTYCLSGYFENISEMTFYRDSYQAFIDTAEVENNLDLTECTVNWYYHLNNNIQDIIWHELTITLGHVWLVDTNTEPVDDILAY